MTASRVRTRPSQLHRAPKPATAKSVEFLTRLLAERDVPADARTRMENAVAAHHRAGTDDALPGDVKIDQSVVSGAIDWLKAQGAAQNVIAVTTGDAPAMAKVIEGLYEHHGALYLVKLSKSARLYAMVLSDPNGETLLANIHEPTECRYVYAPGMMRELRAAERITVERAEELSKWLTFCARCGAHLTADDSIEAGMGEVCRTKQG